MRATAILLAATSTAAFAASNANALVQFVGDSFVDPFAPEVAEGLFLAAAGPVLTESFEDAAITNNTASYTLLETTHFDVSSTNTTFGVMDAANYFGTFAVDGNNYLVNVLASSGSWVFDFDSPLTAFGVWITDPRDFGNQAMRFTVGTEPPTQFLGGSFARPDGTSLFVGYVAEEGESFSSFTIFNGGDAIGIDKVQFAFVPAPGAAALLLVGGSAAARRRRA